MENRIEEEKSDSIASTPPRAHARRYRSHSSLSSLSLVSSELLQSPIPYPMGEDSQRHHLMNAPR